MRVETTSWVFERMARIWSRGWREMQSDVSSLSHSSSRNSSFVRSNRYRTADWARGAFDRAIFQVVLIYASLPGDLNRVLPSFVLDFLLLNRALSWLP